MTYVIEKANDNSYSFKSYWSPRAVNADEAKRLTRFIEAVEQVTGYGTRTDFDKSVPFLSYSTSGPTVAMQAITKKQARVLHKAQKAYQKSHPKYTGKANLNIGN